MSQKRPDIEEWMKRNIRQRCAYGCVICGRPIYEYHHIYEYDEKVGHKELEITLLCDCCHRKEQGGLISRDFVRAYDAAPCNRMNGETTPDRIWYSLEPCKVIMGTYEFTTLGGSDFVALMMDGKPMVRFVHVEGVWHLSLSILDSDNTPLLEVIENEITYKVTELDVEYTGGTFTVRGQPGRIYFRASFKAPTLTITHGLFMYNGICLGIDHGNVVPGNPGCPMMRGIEIHYSPVGLLLGRNPGQVGSAIYMPVPKRFPLDKKELQAFMNANPIKGTEEPELTGLVDESSIPL